jgi:predicted glycoside hydrolase/deacetylase ChbG (UPF0249 family)
MPAAASRHLTVCVDDFGLHDGVNQAVCQLVAQGRVTAVSCLVDGLAWAGGVAQLRQVAGQGASRRADVGLHLNFSETLMPPERTGSAWAARPVSRLIAASCLRQLDVAVLRADIDRQWRAFEAQWGQAPDFIDGHQHVHQLPQIRDALFAAIDARRAQLPSDFWLRDCGTSVRRQARAGVPLAVALKAGVIATLGSGALRRLAARRGLRTSGGLLGAYPFNTDVAGYLALWQAWLKLVPARGAHGDQGGLLMCHPASQLVQGDAIAAARRVEFEALRGAAWAAMLAQAGVEVTRLAHPASLPG